MPGAFAPWLNPGHAVGRGQTNSRSVVSRPLVSPHRRRVVVVLIVLTAVLLLVRVCHLFITQGSFLRLEGDKRTVRSLSVAAHRGAIRDRSGVNLAISTPVISLWCDPRQVPRDEATYHLIASHLDKKNPQDIEALLREHGSRHFLYLARQLSPEVAQGLLAEQIPGIEGQTEYKRFYPQGAAAAHVVGLTDIDQAGQEGVELAFESLLMGHPGAFTIIEDLHHRMIQRVGLTAAPRPGRDITLTIDSRFQHAAHSALAQAVNEQRADAGTLVAIDVRSGAILAMASYPSFNPNDRQGLAPDAVRNRAIADVFEPGSTIKPFTVLAAMDEGLYAPDTLIDTSPGYMNVSGKQVKDFRNYGLLDVAGVIQKSSNVGVVKMALDLPEQALPQWLARLGFGMSTGIGLRGERDGVLPIWAKPKRLDRATLAYGYGLSVTALQLASAYATLASGGIKREPTLFMGERRLPSERVMGQGLAWEITRMLIAVTEPGGTAQKAAIAGYHVAGKTGTVYKMTPGGYADDAYQSLFAGFAPATAPRVAMAIMIDNPKAGEHFGGAVAAPVFAKVMGDILRYEGIAPDALPAGGGALN